ALQLIMEIGRSESVTPYFYLYRRNRQQNRFLNDSSL
ncbi:MAG: hypothetical protein ACI8PD_002227, partial [Nitrospinales bacterium]